jgi:uncharacterized protein (DUF1330 family)
MAAYFVCLYKKLHDKSKIEAYWAKAGPTMKGFAVKPLAGYTRFKVLEGDDTLLAVAMAEFASMDEATRWYESPAYAEVRKLRLAGADFLTFIVEGGFGSEADRMAMLSKA